MVGFIRFDPLAFDENIRVANFSIFGKAGYVSFKINCNFLVTCDLEIIKYNYENDNSIEGKNEVNKP